MGKEAAADAMRFPLAAVAAWLTLGLQHCVGDFTGFYVQELSAAADFVKTLKSVSHGVVLIVLPHGIAADPEVRKPLAEALAPWADKFRDTLRFTFFSRDASTKEICEAYGIQTDSEIMLLENPSKTGTLGDTHVVGAPKYRKAGVNPDSIQEFFDAYEVGNLPRYYRTTDPEPTQEELDAVVHEDMFERITRLTSWTFDLVVNDPGHSVVVLYTTASCSQCRLTEMALDDVRKKVKDDNRMKSLVFATIYQDAHEHSEVVLSVPSLQYWPWGRNKSPVEIKEKDPESIHKFLLKRVAHLEL